MSPGGSTLPHAWETHAEADRVYLYGGQAGNCIFCSIPQTHCKGHAAGPESARLSSQSIRSVARGSMGLNPADPLLRQNEEVLQVGVSL